MFYGTSLAKTRCMIGQLYHKYRKYRVSSLLLSNVSLSFMTLVDVKYQQGYWNQCLFKVDVSAFHYCGLEQAASHFSTTAPTVQLLPPTTSENTSTLVCS
jgi:hypothetical protein